MSNMVLGVMILISTLVLMLLGCVCVFCFSGFGWFVHIRPLFLRAGNRLVAFFGSLFVLGLFVFTGWIGWCVVGLFPR